MNILYDNNIYSNFYNNPSENNILVVYGISEDILCIIMLYIY